MPSLASIIPATSTSGAGLFAQMRGVFFDSDLVLRTVNKTKRKLLSRFGAYLRREARQSIRKRKKMSEPGQPPSSHKGWLKQHIYFAWDSSTESVVIGPIQLGRGTAPAALEHGGPSLAFRRFKKANGQWVTEIREIPHIRPRPFMRPAMARILPKFAGLFKGQIEGALVNGG